MSTQNAVEILSGFASKDEIETEVVETVEGFETRRKRRVAKKEVPVIERYMETVESGERTYCSKSGEEHSMEVVGSDVVVSVYEPEHVDPRTHVINTSETRSKVNVEQHLPYEQCSKHVRDKREVADWFYKTRNSIPEHKKPYLMQLLKEQGLKWNVNPKNSEENKHSQGTI